MADDKRIAPGPASRWIIRNLRGYREERKLSYAELSERLTELGRPIPPLGLRRIENGDRRVDVDDVIAIARVLDVPPVLLLFPLGEEASTEILPGVERPTWPAVKWFVGDGSFPAEEPSGRPDILAGEHADVQAYFDSATPLILHRALDRLMDEMRWKRGRVAVIADAIAKAVSTEAKAAHEERLTDARQELAGSERLVVEHRQKMRQAGVTPPALESALAHLDNGGGDQGGSGT